MKWRFVYGETGNPGQWAINGEREDGEASMGSTYTAATPREAELIARLTARGHAGDEAELEVIHEHG